jgi:hypothetical protein
VGPRLVTLLVKLRGACAAKAWATVGPILICDAGPTVCHVSGSLAEAHLQCRKGADHSEPRLDEDHTGRGKMRHPEPRIPNPIPSAEATADNQEQPDYDEGDVRDQHRQADRWRFIRTIAAFAVFVSVTNPRPSLITPRLTQRPREPGTTVLSPLLTAG